MAWRPGAREDLTVFIQACYLKVTWKSAEQWLEDIENNLLQSRVRVRRGGQYDQWDLHVTCGFFASAKGLLTIEEHGSNKQLLRFKCKPE